MKTKENCRSFFSIEIRMSVKLNKDIDDTFTADKLEQCEAKMKDVVECRISE